MLRAAQALAVSLVLLAAGCGERPAADDAAFHADVVGGRAGSEVTVDGTLAGEPQAAGGHEHLRLRVPTGERVEVDHNTTLAPWVPAHAGDAVVVHGRLYIDPGGPGIHCTHARTSGGCPQPGWVGLRGNYYE